MFTSNENWIVQQWIAYIHTHRASDERARRFYLASGWNRRWRVGVMPLQMGKWANPNGMSKQHPFPLYSGVPFNKLYRKNLHFVLAKCVRASEWKIGKVKAFTNAFHFACCLHQQPAAAASNENFSSNFPWRISKLSVKITAHSHTKVNGMLMEDRCNSN